MFQSRNDIRQALHRSSKLLSGCHGSFAACAEAAVACQSENISGSVFGPEGSFLSRVKDAQIRLMRWRLLSALLATLPAVGQPVPPTEELAAGGRSYSLLCVQCHGEDGDATSQTPPAKRVA